MIARCGRARPCARDGQRRLSVRFAPRDSIPANPRGLAGVGGTLQGDRRHCARAKRFESLDEGDETRDVAVMDTAAWGRSGERGRRPASPRLHLLPPIAGLRRAGGAHAARGLRPDDGGDRAGVSDAGADAGAADRPREGEDPRRQDSVCLTYSDGLRGNGTLLAAERLQSTDAAATVRVRRGKMSVVDGPFAETKDSSPVST